MSGCADVYARDQLQDTALHSHARSDLPVLDKMNMLIAILTFSKLGCKDIDVKALYGNTALHIAAQVRKMVVYEHTVHTILRSKHSKLYL